MKLSPRALRLLEPSSLEEKGTTAWRLFDRSTSEGWVPPASSGQDAVLEVALESPSFLRALKVFGAAPYTLRVEREDGSALPGLEEVELSILPNTAGWNALELSSPSEEKSLRLRFTSQGEDTPLPEVEIWGEREALEQIPSVTSLSLEKLKEEKTQYSSRYTAVVGEPTEMVLTPLDAPPSLEMAGPGVPCGVATFSLEQHPSLFSRVYLAYDANVFRPWVLKRSVNGSLFAGGFLPMPPQEVSLPFLEELDPERLSLGINSVELCVPSGMSGEVFVQNLRLLAEKETGKHFITSAHLEDSAGTPLEENTDAAFDGDLSTSLSLSSQKNLALELSRLVSPDALALSLSDSASPLGALQCLKEGSWENILPAEAKKRSLWAGRNLLALPEGVEGCQSLRLRLSGGEPISLQEVEILGSGSKERVDWPKIQITSALEHYGKEAVLQGFAQKPSAVSGPVRISIDGKPWRASRGCLTKGSRERETPICPGWSPSKQNSPMAASCLKRSP